MEADMLASLKNKEKYSRYFGSLKYALYVITHPLDGFWDLTHEKRGFYCAANTIDILSVLHALCTAVYKFPVYAGLLGRCQYLFIYCKYSFSIGAVLRWKLGTYHTV